MALLGEPDCAQGLNATELDEATKFEVLIAMDGSQESENALIFYSTHIHRPGNEVLLVHGAELPQMGVSEAAVMCQSYWDQMLEGEKSKVQQLEEKWAELMQAHNLTGKIQAIFCGKPGELIVELAEKEKVSCIVIGSRGNGLIRRTLMGSVSDYVLHHAHCPVIICPRNRPRKRSSLSTSSASSQ